MTAWNMLEWIFQGFALSFVIPHRNKAYHCGFVQQSEQSCYYLRICSHFDKNFKRKISLITHSRLNRNNTTSMFSTNVYYKKSLACISKLLAFANGNLTISYLRLKILFCHTIMCNWWRKILLKTYSVTVKSQFPLFSV